MSHGANFLIHNIFVIPQAGYNSFKVPLYLILPNKLMKWSNEVFMVNIIWVSDLVSISFRILKLYHYSLGFFSSHKVQGKESISSLDSIIIYFKKSFLMSRF